ncbi:MAG: hypothetical protein LBP28_05730 [Coriobacteriales bacterium]|jgi:hypothetical protein|nr:hypothetical protein [Coriobacteriales bacterium]
MSVLQIIGLIISIVAFLLAFFLLGARFGIWLATREKDGDAAWTDSSEYLILSMWLGDKPVWCVVVRTGCDSCIQVSSFYDSPDRAEVAWSRLTGIPGGRDVEAGMVVAGTVEGGAA